MDMYENEDNDFKTIKFEMRSNNGEKVTVEKSFPDHATWMEISAYYYNFLSGIGYELQPADVGA
jgi:hypothetical protein